MDMVERSENQSFRFVLPTMEAYYVLVFVAVIQIITKLISHLQVNQEVEKIAEIRIIILLIDYI